MTTLVLVLIVVALLLVAGGGVRAHGRNAQEMTDQGNRVDRVPGFDRRDGPL